MNKNNATPKINTKEQVDLANIFELMKHIRKQTMRNLLGHNCKVTALPEGAESWFSRLDSILPGEVNKQKV